MKNFAIRKVRKGRVKIGGRWYAPKLPAPQLEGLWLAFGIYGLEKGYVSLWGTRDCYMHVFDEVLFNSYYDAQIPLLTKDGAFLWEWWYALSSN